MSPRKYILIPPEELNPYIPSYRENLSAIEDEKTPSDIYPDFQPWIHTPEEDQILLNFVSKGYYVSSKVNFESISARSSLHESLPTLSNQLSEQFSKVLQIREKKINKIRSSNRDTNNSNKNKNRHCTFSTNPLASPYFVVPNRVTLTDNRKEQWLQELSSPYASLSKTSEFIPHGLKRRQVIEQCYIKQIPLKRATWLIKCCYSIEAQTLKVKYSHGHPQSKQDPQTIYPNIHEDYTGVDSNTSTKENAILYKDWTDTFVYILEKLIFEMNQHSNDPIKLKSWKTEFAYFLKLLGNCYTLNLLDREIFFHWLVEYVSKIENFEYLPLSLHILNIFWNDITCMNDDIHSSKLSPNEDNHFLVSKITDTLLNKYYVISNSKSMINDEKYIINDIKKNNKIKKGLLEVISDLICRLFQEQSLEIFLFPPPSWELYKPCLFEITNTLQSNKTEIRKKLELISYRNDTLKNNTLLATDEINENSSGTSNSHMLFGTNYFDVSDIFCKSTIEKNSKVINIPNCDVKFIKLLDDNKTDFDWVQYIDQNPLQLSQIIQLIIWSIHPSRRSHYESNQLVVKLLLLQINSLDSFPEYEIEDTIWSLVFQIAKLSKKNLAETVDNFLLYQLLNILNTYGMIKVPTYIRKLISSGIMYLHDSNDKFFHVSLLINLKISPVVKSQYNMVLRNVIEYAPEYYEKYNYDQLVQDVETCRDDILNERDIQNLEDLPLSGRIMLGEWYLNYLCSNETFDSVDTKTLIATFKTFCLDLQVFHLFYKWIEFIVYHQLLADISSMETLTNILLRYQLIFSQFINDHILFTKTLIFIYHKVLKKKDAQSYNISTLMPFWKFCMKSFPMALMIDDDLRTELHNVYEEEKLKIEKLQNNKEYAKHIFNLINKPEVAGPVETPRDISLNFTEIFQTNIKQFLSPNAITAEDRKKSRCNLLLLMNANNREYTKFMSIFLKRKNFDNDGLITLISNQLLTLDQIRRILGINKVLELYDLKYESPEYYIFFDGHKKDYVTNKYELILSACLLNITQYYSLFFMILNEFGPISKLSMITTKIIENYLKENPTLNYRVIYDLLSYGQVLRGTLSVVNETESATESEDELTSIGADDIGPHSNDVIKFYSRLDFTNLWIFQALTNFYINTIKENNKNENEYYAQLKHFFFSIIRITTYNELCSHLFDTVDDIDMIKHVVNIVEEDFLQKCLSKSEIERNVKQQDNRDYLLILIKLVTSLSKRIGNYKSPSMELSNNCFDKLQLILIEFSQFNEEKLHEIELTIDVLMKIFIVHENSIFEYIVIGLQEQATIKRMNNFIQNILTLFENISFNIRLKLMVYEILTSLKSYCIYMSTTMDNSNSTASPPHIMDPNKAGSSHSITSMINNSAFNRSISNISMSYNGYYSSSNVRFEIPELLLQLPPFQVSSFMRKTDNISTRSTDTKLNMGIKFLNNNNNNNNSNNGKNISSNGLNRRHYSDNHHDDHNQISGNKWFLYDKVKENYVCKLDIKPYHCINNYQPNPDGTLNNSCFNLSLFDAALDNKNPK